MLMNRCCGAFAVLVLLLPAVCPALALELADAWAPIAADDLALKDNPADPGAAAMVLLNEVETRDDKRYETHHVVIKTFTDEGRKYADVELPYYEKYLSIDEIRGRTVHRDGTVTSFNGTIFDSTIVRSRRLKLQAKKFTLPAVAAGDVIEYAWVQRWRYRLSPYFTRPRDYVFDTTYAELSTAWSLQGDLFTREAHYRLYPVKGATLNWDIVPASQAAQLRREGDVVLVDIRNMPAFLLEPFSLPEEMVRPTAYLYYVTGFLSDNSTFWSDVGARHSESYDKFIGRSNAIRKHVQTLVAPDDDHETKLRKLYARTKQLRFLSEEVPRTKNELKREHLKQNKSAEDVLRNGHAWGNEINLFFIALARAAGFTAYPIELRARDIGRLNVAVWDETQFNGMIVAVEIPKQKVYLDPATLPAPYGVLPWEETAQPALAVKGKWSELVTLPMAVGDAVVHRKAELMLLPDGTLEGELQWTYTGQPALDHRRGDDREKQIENEIKEALPPGVTMERFLVHDWEDIEKPLRVEAHVRIPGYAMATARRLVVPVDPLAAKRKHPFTAAQRKSAIYFPYPIRFKDDVAFTAPEGYALERTLPAMQFENGVGTFRRAVIAYKPNDGKGSVKVVMSREFALKGFAYPAAVYPELRKLYDEVLAADQEQFVLKATGGT